MVINAIILLFSIVMITIETIVRHKSYMKEKMLEMSTTMTRLMYTHNIKKIEIKEPILGKEMKLIINKECTNNKPLADEITITISFEKNKANNN